MPYLDTKKTMYRQYHSIHESRYLMQARLLSQYVDLPHISMPTTPSRMLQFLRNSIISPDVCQLRFLSLQTLRFYLCRGKKSVHIHMYDFSVHNFPFFLNNYLHILISTIY